METIKITIQGFEFDEVATELKNLADSDTVEVKVKPSSIDFGGLALDPATIIVSGAGVLSSLITALFTYMATKRNGSIIITGSRGRKIEIPKNTPKEEIEFYIEQAQKLDAEQIALVRLP